MTDDLVRRLRATDPAARAALPATGDDAMREAIMTTTDERSAPAQVPGRATRQRRWRRGGIAAVLSLALLGGGAAVAGYHGWYLTVEGMAGGNEPSSVSCTSDWAGRDQAEGSASGPLLTGDPVADCQSYRAESGLPPILDPVAFWHSSGLWVVPADQVPADARVQTNWSREMALRELRSSVTDWVDGVTSRCTSAADAAPVVEALVAELGLDLPVEVEAGDDGPDSCSAVDVAGDGSGVTVRSVPRSRNEAAWLTEGPVAVLRDRLRAEIAQTCVDLDTATAVTVDALGAEHHWPTVVIEDPSSTCTRVDLEAGGSVQVTLRGPRG